MHEDKFLEKQIQQMVTDIFPLDRVLPISTVFKILEEHYGRISDKQKFFKERKYQRLREGYFAMFTAVALNKLENKEHFLLFPRDPMNDVNILSIKDIEHKHQDFWKLTCDIKEYTSFEKSLDGFLNKVVRKGLESYHVIIGAYVDEIDMKPIANFIKKENLTNWIFLISSPTQNDQNYKIGLVTIFSKEKGVIQESVDLEEYSQGTSNEPLVVFQNLLRDKPNTQIN